jgi:deoxyadenosine/deoxycytidine kinase
MNSPKVIFIEGNIASGKTTFINLLPEVIDCQIILEPLDMWKELVDSKGKNILDYFYTDMPKYAYPFQSFAFLSRVKSVQNINSEKPYVFVERSIFSDKNIFAKNCYMNGIMTEIEWNLYNQWFDWMRDSLKIDNPYHIYMKCDPDVSYKRLLERSRQEEAGVSLKYLTEIYNRHEEWLGNYQNCLTVDASQGFRDDKNIMKNLVNQITDYVNTSSVDHYDDRFMQNDWIQRTINT